MASYIDYQNILSTHNFIGGAGRNAIPHLILDTRTEVERDGNQVYQFYYMTLVSLADFYALGYYDSNDREYLELPIGNDPALSYNQLIVLSSILNGDAYSSTFSDVSKINFNQGNAGNSHIILGETTNGGVSPLNVNSDDGGYELDYSSGWNALKHGDVWLNQDFDANGDGTGDWITSDKGSLAYMAIMHELAHSLGLSHPALNGELDNQKYTIMSSKVMAGMDPDGSNNEVTPWGLQLFDIAAIQEIYGRNYSTRAGTTTYSKLTAFESGRPNNAFLYTIWDGDGIDLIDASEYTDKVVIDLRQGNFSSIGKAAENNYNGERGVGLIDDNLAIAYYTVIENATGTNYSDILIGNAWDNTLIGGGGDDYIYGDGIVSPDGQAGFSEDDPDRPGPSAAEDGSGNDTLYGGAGNDYLYGGAGYDFLYGGDDNDHLYVGAGGGWAFGDAGNDHLYGSGSSDVLVGGAGNDTFYAASSGGKLTESSYAGESDDYGDIIDYSHVGFGLYVFLSRAQTSFDGSQIYKSLQTHESYLWAGINNYYDTTKVDTTSGIENFILGSAHDDHVIVNAGDIEKYQVYAGSGGRDILSITGDINGPFSSDMFDDNFHEFEEIYLAGAKSVANMTLSNSNYTMSQGLDRYFLDYGAAGYNSLQITNQQIVFSKGGVSDVYGFEPSSISLSPIGLNVLGSNAANYSVNTSSGAEHQLRIFTGTGDDVFSGTSRSYLNIVYTGGDDVINLSYPQDISLNIVGAGADLSFQILNKTYIGIDAQGYNLYEMDLKLLVADLGTVRVNNLRFRTEYSNDGTKETVVDSAFNFYSDNLWYALSGVPGASTPIFRLEYLGSYEQFVQGVGTSGGDVLSGSDLIGRDGNDTLNGLSSVKNILKGGNGEDHLYGGSLADTLIGGNDDDHIYGRGSADGLVEHLEGGAGNDSYYYSSGDRLVSILDSAGADDKIILGAGITKSDVTLNYNGDTLISISLSNSQPDRIMLNGGIEKLVFSNSEVINLVNAAPKAEDDYFEAYKDAPIQGNVLSDNGNGADVDSDNDVLTVLAGTYSTWAGGTVIIGENGDFTYAPASGYTGHDFFDYTLTDGNLRNDTGRVLFNINEPPVNSNPDVQNDTFTVVYGDTVIGNVLADNGYGADSDSDGGTLSVEPISGFMPGKGTINLQSDGSITFKPIAGYVGVITFDYVLYDGQGGSNTGIVSVNITAPSGAIVGTENSDTLTGNNSADIIFSLSGDDVIFGGNGNDVIHAGGGADTIYGEDGDDVIIGSEGDDSLFGGEGADSFVFEVLEDMSANTDHIGDFSLNDKIDLSAIENLVFIGETSFTNVAGQVRYVFENGSTAVEIDSTGDGIRDHRIIIDNGEFNLIETEAGSKILITDLTNGPVAQNDDFSINYAANLVGNVLVNNGMGSDVGAPGRTLAVSQQTIISDAGVVVSMLLDGSFTYNADPGHFGVDTFTYTLSDGEGGTDTATVTINISPPTYTHVGTNGNNIYLGSAGADVYYGLLGNDTIIGMAGADTLYGGGGNDTIVGADGADVLYGNIGDDTLNGGAGADHLYGGKGNDLLTGGLDNDSFIFESLSDISSIGDHITDFTEGDEIDLSTMSELSFIGSAAFSNVIGQVRYVHASGVTIIEIDSTGDGIADHQITLDNGEFNLAETNAGSRVLVIGTSNIGPIAQDDAFSTSYGTNVVGNVLSNNGNGADSDSNGGTLSVIETSITSAAGIIVSMLSNGSFVYNANASYVGTDTFSYTLSDGQGGTDVGQVTINVSGPTGAIVGTASADVLTGTNANNTIFSLNGNDTIYGGSGVDKIYGGLGSDTLHGEAAHDEYYFTSAGEAEGDVIEDNGDTASSNDKLYFTNLSSYFTPVLRLESGNTLDLLIDTAYGVLRIKNQYASDASDRVEVLYQQLAGQTTINATSLSAGGFSFYGSAGNDILSLPSYGISTASNHSLYGLEGNDTITGSSRADYLYGGEGNDIIDGGDGNDTVLDGGNGDDVIYGGAGGDHIYGGLGSDTLYGGTANDGYYFTSAGEAEGDVIEDNGDTASSNDKLHFTNLSSYFTPVLRLESGNTLDLLIDTAYGVLRIKNQYASDASDRVEALYQQLAGQTAINATSLSAGGFSFYGSAGNDILSLPSYGISTASNHSLYGLEGNDTITGSNRADYLYGGDGNDIIDGGDGNDTVLDGGNGDDVIYGGAGGDRLYGGLGSDTLHGGTANDGYYFTSAGEAEGDVIEDNGDTASSNDGLHFTNLSSYFTPVLRLESGNTLDLLIDTAYGVLRIKNQYASDASDRVEALYQQLAGQTAINATSLSAGGFSFYGSAGNDILSLPSYGISTTSNHSLYGLEGNDTITGSSRSDYLYGGDGDDILYGGQARDYLYGDNGADTFLYESASDYSTSDYIYDFDKLEGDKIDISSLLQGYDPLTDLITDFVRITDSGSNSILAVDVNGGANSFVNVATLMGVTGLTDEEALATSGNLVVV